MAKMYRYTVIGSGDFPIDMLRYDSAYPVNEQDAPKIAPSRWRHESHYEQRAVELRSAYPPTDGRWKSFGWTVLTDSIRRTP